MSLPGAHGPDPRILAALQRLARLEAVAVVLIEREQLRRDPRGPYDDPIRRTDADNRVLDQFLSGVLESSRVSKKGGATMSGAT